MSTNGKQKPLAELREDYKRLRLTLRTRQLERSVKLLESFNVQDWVQPYVDLLDRYRDGQQLLSPISTPNDRRYGRNFPLYQTEQELALLRAPARILCSTNPYAQGLVGGLVAYTIGTGCTYRVVPKADGVGPDLVEKAQDVLDEFCERSEWPGWEAELCWRSHEDGEWILRHFFTEDGRTAPRTVEPEQVFQPPDKDQREWSFGFRSDPEDPMTVSACWVGYFENPADGEEVPLSEIVHAKCNVKRVNKRGMTDFCFGTYDALDIAQRLRRNLGEGAAIQAALAGIRQHDSASQAQIQSFQAGTVDYSVTDPVTGRGQDNTRWTPGTIHDVPKGLNWVDPPGAHNAEAHTLVLQACLRGAAVRWNAPEWLGSSDSSNNNYASSLTAEAPFTIRIRQRQKFVTDRFKRTMRIVLTHAAAAGRLPRDVLQLVDVQCEAPSPIARDPQKDAQVNQTYIGLGVKSRQTAAQEQGLDWDVEQQNIEEWEKEHPQQQEPEPGQEKGQGGGERREAKPGLREARGEGDGQWMTIGGHKGEDGKKHGGSPVYIENGRITKGHPSLHGKQLGNLKGPAQGETVRTANKQGREYAQASYRKQAKKAGIRTEDLDSLAAQIKGHDEAFAADRKQLLQRARALFQHYGYNAKALTTNLNRGHVEDEVPGLDVVADSLQRSYPEQFSGHEDNPSERLLDLFREGTPEPMSHEEAYAQAFDHLSAQVPDDEQGDAWEPDARGHHEKEPWDFAGRTERRGELLEASGQGAHAPAGYTEKHPLMIQGHAFTGGMFVPGHILDRATDAEKAALKKEGPAAREKPKKGKARGKEPATPAGGVAGYPRPAARNGRDAEASGLPARGTKAQNQKPWDPVEKAQAIEKTLKEVDGGKPGSWTQANATVMERVFAHALNFDHWGENFPADIAGVVKIQGKATRVGIDLKTAVSGTTGNIKKDDNAESLKIGFVTEGLDQGGFSQAASLSGNPNANVKSLMFFLAVNANHKVKEVPALDPKTGRGLKDASGQPVMKKAGLLFLQAGVRGSNYKHMVPIEVEGLNDVSDLTKPEVLAKVREKVLTTIQDVDPAQFGESVKDAGDKLHTRLIRGRSRQDASLEAAGVELDEAGKAQAEAGRALKAKERAQAKAREVAKENKELKAKQDALQQLAESDPKLAAKLRKAGLL